MLHREFPDQASEWTDPVTRRRLPQLMGASLALAGLTGCSTQPARARRSCPTSGSPEAMVPGQAAVLRHGHAAGGLATGVLVESHEGRPTKIEGNPQHPASLGATDLLTQASILGLYDPDRSQTVTYRGRPRAWNEAVAGDPRSALDKLKTAAGRRPAHPDRDGHLADAGRPDRRSCSTRTISRSASGISTSRSSRDRAAQGRKLAFGEAVNTHLPLRQGRRHPVARRRLPARRGPARCATPAISASAAACGRRTGAGKSR